MRHIIISALFLLIALSASSQSNRIYWWQMKWAPVDGDTYIPASNPANGRVDLYPLDSIDLDTRIDSLWTSNDTLYARVTRISGGPAGSIDTLYTLLPEPDLSTYLEWADTVNVIATHYYVNNQGYITGLAWDEIGGDQTDIDLNGFANADSFLKSGDNISELDNDSGYLTGNQIITLSGDVTGSGSTGISTTIANNVVSDAKLRTSAALSAIVRSSNSVGNVADILFSTNFGVLHRSGTSLSTGLLSGSSISATNNQLFYGVGGVAAQSGNMTYDGSNFGITANSIFTGQFSSVSNIQSGVNYSGTSIATATGAYGVRYNYTLTANNSANHTLEGVRFAPTLIAASNFNFLYGVVIDPTFTNGAFTSVNNVPLQIVERTVDGQTIRIQHASGTSVGGITINDVSNVQRYALSYNGSSGQAISNMSGSSQNRFNYSNSSLLIQNAFQTKASYANTTGYYAHAPTNSTATSGTSIAHYLSHSFAPTSGTGVHNWLQIDGAINQTGGANGITRGIYLNHTLTSAVDYRAIEVATGKTKLRDLETGSADAIYLGAATTDGTWRMIRSGNDLLMQRRESGSYVTKQTITP